MFLNLQRRSRVFHPIRALTSFISGIDQVDAHVHQPELLQTDVQIITLFDIAIAGAALMLVLFVNLFL